MLCCPAGEYSQEGVAYACHRAALWNLSTNAEIGVLIIPGLLLLLYEKNQGLLEHGKPKNNFLRWSLDMMPEEKNTQAPHDSCMVFYCNWKIEANHC